MAYQGRSPTLSVASKLDPLVFNGTDTLFNLTKSGTLVSPGLSEHLFVSLNGVLQEPGSAYQVIGSQIQFSEAPASTDESFIVAGSLKMTTNAGNLQRSGDTMDGALNFAPTQSVASAATVNLGGVNSNSVLITGTTTINSLGAAASGTLKIVRFASELTLTNSANLILPGLENVKTQPNDMAIFESFSSGVWYCVSYSRSLAQAGMIANAELENLDALTKTGIYRLNGGNAGGPFSGNLFGMLFVMRSFGDTLAQIYIDHATSKSYTRGGSGYGSNWGAWRESVDTDSPQTLRNKSIVENVNVINSYTVADAGQTYVFTAQLTLCMPEFCFPGDRVTVIDRSGTTTSVIFGNGENIMGLMEDVTLDTPNFSGTFMYTDATRGWVIL